MSSSQIIGAVEIGTSKVAVLVGEITPPRALNIIGHAECSTVGVRKGEVTDFRAAANCVHTAIVAAEKNAGTTLDGVYLAISGGFLHGFAHSGTVTVASSEDIVSAGDVTRASDLAKSKLPPPGQIYIHHIRSGFRLDGKRVEDPVGMRGTKLEALYWHVLGDQKKVTNQLQVINSFGGIEVRDLIISAAASATIVVSAEEKRAGVLVVDIGCGTTDWALYQGGLIAMTGAIPVGGDHLTNDLSLGLRIPGKRAEVFKRDAGKAIVDKEDQGESIWVYGDLTIGDRRLPRLAINQILSARVEEIFTLIKRQLGTAASRTDIPAGVVLTGGTSRLPGLPEAARRVLGLDVRLGESPPWVGESALRLPEYSTVLGLLYYGLSAHPTEAPRPARAGFLGKVAELLRFS